MPEPLGDMNSEKRSGFFNPTSQVKLPENKMGILPQPPSQAGLPENKMGVLPQPRGPSESEKLGYGVEAKNRLGEEEDPRNREMEAAFANERLSYESRYAKQDRLLARLIKAETPKDVAPCIEALRKFENWDYREGINSYRFQNMIGQALDNHDAYVKSHAQLKAEGIVDGEISPQGYIANGGRMRFDGYEVRIDEEKVEIVRATRKQKYKEGNNGEKLNLEEWIETETIPQIVEKPCFLPEKERFALAEANHELAKQMIVGQKQHIETEIFDNNRAALEEQVKIFYLKQIGLSNNQFKWFFNAADISKITPEQRENKELGKLRNKAMRLMRLIGHSETKEKMEKYLNETFALEMILDKVTIDRIFEISNTDVKKNTEESNEDYINRRFEAAAKFLIGDGLKISYAKRYDTAGKEVLVKQYEVGGWLTAEERDLTTNIYRGGNVHDKGADAVSFESKKLRVRGYITGDGNIFSRGEKDIQYSALGKIGFIIGDKSQSAVKDADRMFWTRGEKDELGPEYYAFKHRTDKSGKIVFERDNEGNIIPDLPTGEELVAKWNECLTEEEWKTWGRGILKRFSLPGEPVGSDLSKLFWTYLYRLKDQLSERPTGLLLSTDKVKRLSQSLLSLARTEAETGYLREVNGKIEVVKTKTLRSLREQWEGYKGDQYLAIEKPIDLGDLKWEQVRAAEEVEEIVVHQKREVTNHKDAKEVKEKVWKLIGVSEETKKELINKYGDEDRAQAAVIGDTFAKDDGGVGDNADGFYKLMNFLAGDGNPEKRPWAYLTNTKLDPKDFTVLDTWTAKNKFLQIINNAAGMFGDFRRHDRNVVRRNKELSLKAQKDSMKNEADANITAAKMGWFDSVRAHPMYPAWRMNTVDYQIYDEKGRMKSDKAQIYQIVEGFDANRPGMAVRYGFMSPEQIGKPPRSQMKTFYY